MLKISRYLIMILLLVVLVSACGQQDSGKMATIDDVANKKIGVYTGTIYDKFARERFPAATILHYNQATDFPLALKSGKIDVAIGNLYQAQNLVQANPELAILTDDVLNFPIGIGFNKNNPALRERFDAFVKAAKADGSFDVMYKKWFASDLATVKMPKFAPNPGGEKVILAVAVGDLPSSGIINGEYAGFDVELIQTFAHKENINLEIISLEFGALVAAVASGKADMIADCIAITEERKQQVAFSAPYMEDKTALYALKKNIATAAPKQGGSQGKIATVDDLAMKKIGVPMGTVYDTFVPQRLPAASVQLYNDTSDLAIALKTGKIDAVFDNLDAVNTLIKDNPDLALLADDVMTTPIGVGFNKNNPALRARFNDFLAKAKADGSFETLYKRWYESDLSAVKPVKFPSFPDGEKVTLGINMSTLPITGYIDGEYTGFDVELIQTFAYKENMNLQILTMDFGAMIPALAAGKVDMIATSISITDERKQQIDFSDPYMDDKTGVMVLKKNLAHAGAVEQAKQVSFLQSIRDGFTNNMIRENRYLLIVDGLKTTALISVFSIIVGTLLGAVICLLRMSRYTAAVLFARFYIALIRGIPVLVLLMLMYYVVFGSVSISPVLVAVLAFGINFAAYVAEMFRAAIHSIDKGQTEAGIANGFSKVQTFVYIVMPQAIKQVLPVYKGELISLVKMTSIVGYVAVQDLTKASDIIRSRTFDAFFPLIMTAVLYFFISWVMLELLELAERHSDPRRQRSKAAVRQSAAAGRSVGQ